MQQVFLILSLIAIDAFADRAIVFCFADEQDQLCKPYQKLIPSVYSSLDIKSIPKEIRYAPEKIQRFICRSYQDFFLKNPSSRVTTILSAHGHATGTEPFYEQSGDDNREVRGQVKLFLSETVLIDQNQKIDAEKVISSIGSCLADQNRESTVVVDACRSGAVCKAISKSESSVDLSRLSVLATCLDCTPTGYEAFIDRVMEMRKRCTNIDLNKDGIVSAQEYTDAIHQERGFGKYEPKVESIPSGALKSVTRPSIWGSGGAIPLFAGDYRTRSLFACPESIVSKKKNKEPEPQHYNSDGYQYSPFREKLKSK